MESLTDTALVAERVGLKFDLRYTSMRTVRRTVANWLSTRRMHEAEEFWAFRNISVAIRNGESLGVIGQNGSGKSTLLLTLAGVMEPDEGVVRTLHIPTLLTLGSGFETELTGRQNIFLNGAYLGLGKAEIATKVEDILQFAGLGRFADVPLTKYSTGMRARLGFSIASYVEPDILMLDEVLGVGDLGFQEKSKARMYEMMQGSKALVVVSHNLHFVRETCSHVLWLDEGRVAGYGTADEVIPAYEEHVGLQEKARIDARAAAAAKAAERRAAPVSRANPA